jgi:peptidoglycan/LPS O-acetylase OafA/YrhL
MHTTLPLPAKIRQIDGLQVLRAIAVVLVTMLHARQSLMLIAPAGLPDFGSYGVDIFFVISGFIMSSIVLHSQQSPGPGAAWRFLKRRLIRIFPIYWVFAVAVAARLLLGQGHRLDPNLLPAFLLLPNAHFPYLLTLVDFSWTMMFEMFFYYVFAAVLLVSVRHAVEVVIVLLSCAALLGNFIGTERPYLVVVLSPMLLEFLFGAVLALLHRRLGVKRGAGIGMLLLGIAASFYLRSFTSIRTNGIHEVIAGRGLMPGVLTWGVAAALIVGGIVFWQPSFDSGPGKVAVVLGNASYSAYLASGLAIEFTFRLLLNRLPVATPLSYGMEALYEVSLVASTFCVGWVCYQFIEWPMLRSLQGRFSKAG